MKEQSNVGDIYMSIKSADYLKIVPTKALIEELCSRKTIERLIVKEAAKDEPECEMAGIWQAMRK